MRFKFRYIPTIVYVLLSLWAVVGFLPIRPPIVYYLFSIAYAFYCIINARKVDRLFLAFLLYIPFELLLTQPDSVFQPWLRYGLFFILLINVSPLLQSSSLRSYREHSFLFLAWACAFLGVGSFVARFLSINYMRLPDELDYGFDMINTAGYFAGLTIHSMILGPIAGIGTCFLVSRALLTKKMMYWALAILSLAAVFFSASRSATVATLVGVVITIYKQSRTSSRFLRISIILLVILASTYSFWDSLLVGVLDKNGSASSFNYDSRIELWEGGIKDFLSNPLFGVGFCSTKNISYSLSTGQIESGSSWISVISMLGVVGALFIVSIFIRAFLRAFKRSDDWGPVICGVLVLFFIHMIAEGYIFAGGSFLTLMLWLTIGMATDENMTTNG